MKQARLTSLLPAALTCALAIAAPAAVQAAPPDVKAIAEGIEIVAGVDTTYRELLEALLRQLDVSAEVADERLAAKKTPLRLRGKPEQLLRTLLRGKDFVIVYETRQGDVRISRVIVIGESAKDNLAAVEALERAAARKEPVQQSAEKAKADLPNELRPIAIDAAEYLRRLARQNALFANLDGAYQHYMERMARASTADTPQAVDRGVAGQNRSAGVPRLFVPPPARSSERQAALSMAYTSRMAARDLASLMRALTDDD